MKQPRYAYDVFKHHYDGISSHVNLKNYTVLELGPGDSLFTAIVAKAFGARKCYLVDTSSYATFDLEAYRKMAKFVSEKTMLTLDIENTKTLDELLSLCNTHYGTNGLETLRALPDRSVDFVFSQAVLEHVRKQDFLETLKQIRRIIKDDGICSHSIDMKDHLGGNLNNLRFPEKIWESNFFVRSGFYTNRIRRNKMLELIKQAGFNPEIVRLTHWSKLPISRKNLSNEFKCLSDEELMTSEFDVILHPA
ncbi:MAG: class I SAM-dependent methyltransferase [Planctomycetes bacterium]|nr:class I SAM-dependent methyltransferase [Planctomycetota bacterium]